MAFSDCRGEGGRQGEGVLDMFNTGLEKSGEIFTTELHTEHVSENTHEEESYRITHCYNICTSDQTTLTH